MVTMNKKKKILVTGANGDIGREVLQGLDRDLYQVGGQYCHSLLPSGDLPHVEWFKADLSKAQECIDLADWFISRNNGIDILVHLSGDIGSPVPWADLSIDDWHYDLDINLTSAFMLVQSIQAHIRESTFGKILLISTASVKKGGGEDTLAYGAAKAGIEFLTKQFARYFAPSNVLVNCVSPGFIQTQFHECRAKRTEEDLEKRKSFVPLQRAGTPMEVASLIQFLISDKNSFITGEIIRIDGGDFI